MFVNKNSVRFFRANSQFHSNMKTLRKGPPKFTCSSSQASADLDTMVPLLKDKCLYLNGINSDPISLSCLRKNFLILILNLNVMEEISR